MIPLSVPNLAGNEWKYIKECLDTNWVSSVGAYAQLEVDWLWVQAELDRAVNEAQAGIVS